MLGPISRKLGETEREIVVSIEALLLAIASTGNKEEYLMAHEGICTRYSKCGDYYLCMCLVLFRVLF